MLLILNLIIGINISIAGDTCLETSKNLLKRPSKVIKAEIEAKGETLERLEELQNTLGSEKRYLEKYSVLQRIQEISPNQTSVLIKIAIVQFWLGKDHLRNGEIEKGKSLLEKGLKILYSLPSETIYEHGIAVKIGSALSELGRHAESLPFYKLAADIDTSPTHFSRYEFIMAGIGYIKNMVKESVPEVDHLLADISKQIEYIGNHLPKSSNAIKRFRIVNLKIQEMHAILDAARNISRTLNRLDIENFQADDWYALGDWYQTIGKTKEANAAYDIVLNLDPNSSKAHRRKVDVILRKDKNPENLKKAEHILKEAIFREPKNRLNYLKIFKLYLRENRLQEAIQIADEAITLFGQNSSFVLSLAKEQFRYNLRLPKSEAEKFTLGMQHTLSNLEKYFEIHGFDKDSLELATNVASHLFNYEKTILYGRMYWDLGGSDMHTLQSLGAALRNTNEFAESIPVIKKYLSELDPATSPKYYGLGCAYLGHSYLVVRDYDNAIKYLKIATGSKFATKNAFKNLAFAYRSVSENKESIEIMKKVYEIDKTDFVAVDFLTKAYQKIGDLENETFYAKLRSKLKH